MRSGGSGVSVSTLSFFRSLSPGHRAKAERLAEVLCLQRLASMNPESADTKPEQNDITPQTNAPNAINSQKNDTDPEPNAINFEPKAPNDINPERNDINPQSNATNPQRNSAITELPNISSKCVTPQPIQQTNQGIAANTLTAKSSKRTKRTAKASAACVSNAVISTNPSLPFSNTVTMSDSALMIAMANLEQEITKIRGEKLALENQLRVCSADKLLFMTFFAYELCSHCRNVFLSGREISYCRSASDGCQTD